jgi:hypothetical protein
VGQLSLNGHIIIWKHPVGKVRVQFSPGNGHDNTKSPWLSYLLLFHSIQLMFIMFSQLSWEKGHKLWQNIHNNVYSHVGHVKEDMAIKLQVRICLTYWTTYSRNL